MTLSDLNFVDQKRYAILQFLELAEKDLTKATKAKDEGKIKAYSFLVTEYLEMLRELDTRYEETQYHGA